MAYYNDLESTINMKENLDLSFKDDGHIEMHYFEDPFVEAYASRSHAPLLHDLILHYWIKTHRAEWIDMIRGASEYTIWREHQLPRSQTGFIDTGFVEKQLGFLHSRQGIRIRGRILFKRRRMMRISFHKLMENWRLRKLII